MSRFNKLSFPIIFVLLAAITSQIGTNSSVMAQRYVPKFKYVIYSNSVNENLSRRTVRVILDNDAFSESNLQELHRLITHRFQSPEWLEIYVYTNLKQIETPEEEDLPKSSSSPDNPDLPRSYWAWIYRKGANQFYRYNIKPPGREIKTVVISGRDPF